MYLILIFEHVCISRDDKLKGKVREEGSAGNGCVHIAFHDILTKVVEKVPHVQESSKRAGVCSSKACHAIIALSCGARALFRGGLLAILLLPFCCASV